jgi:hypothetical protein
VGAQGPPQKHELNAAWARQEALIVEPVLCGASSRMLSASARSAVRMSGQALRIKAILLFGFSISASRNEK